MSDPMTMYKATRLDGTDFATRTIDYGALLVSGEWTPGLTRPVICRRGYHVADAAAETLVGGSWPCRLFRVEVGPTEKPGAGSWTAGHLHKGVYRRIRIVEELPASQALGPHGAAVAALIAQSRSITSEQARQLAAARDTAWEAARGAAWVAAWEAARGAARDAARGAAWGAARETAWDPARDAARGAAWGTAWDAAREAAQALVVRDLITSERFATLYGPWESVMGADRG